MQSTALLRAVAQAEGLALLERVDTKPGRAM